MKNTFKQIGREFWFPLVCAASWALYEYCNSTMDTSSVIKSFGGAFFFISWLLAQWFRIRKQQKVDGDLSTIERRVSETLNAVQMKTDDLICHITGGESICYLDVLDRPDKEGNLPRMALCHRGPYPLYHVTLRIADIDRYDREFGSDISFMQYYDNQKVIEVGDLAVNLVRVVHVALPVESNHRYTINFYARNGHFVQQLYFQTTPKGFVLATRVLRGSVVVYEDIPDEFAFDASTGIEWWASDGPG